MRQPLLFTKPIIPSEAARFSLPRRILARRAAESRARSTIAAVPQPAVLLTPLFSDLCVLPSVISVLPFFFASLFRFFNC